jgi:hypothetical protein
MHGTIVTGKPMAVPGAGESEAAHLCDEIADWFDASRPKNLSAKLIG